MPRTLLERLRWPPPTGALPQRPDAESASVLRESIRGNLERILNSRQGARLTFPVPYPRPQHQQHPGADPFADDRVDYGLPDMIDLASKLPAGRADIEKAIRQCIRAFEPRLAKDSVMVRYVHDPNRPLCACFHISARIISKRDLGLVRFETEVGATRAGQADTQVRVECR